MTNFEKLKREFTIEDACEWLGMACDNSSCEECRIGRNFCGSYPGFGSIRGWLESEVKENEEHANGKICEMAYTGELKRTLLAKGTHKGLDYYVLSLGSHPCAYVDYKNYFVDEEEIECHGGVTYHEDYLHLPDGPIEGNFIGWDYSHCYDFTYFEIDRANGVSTLFSRSTVDKHIKLLLPGKKYTTDEMIADCINVIEQIVEVDK